MTDAELQQLAERALERAEGEAQATVTHEHSLLSRFARSTPTQATEIDALSVSVHCVRDGHVAGAATTHVDDDGLADVARRAGEAAGALAREGTGPFPGFPAPAPARRHDGWDPDTARIDPQKAGAGLAAAFGAAERHGVEAFGIWTCGAVRTAIASSSGVRAFDAVTDGHVKVLARGPDGRSGYATDTAPSVDVLDAGAVAEEAAAKVTAQEPRSLEPGEYPVLLSNEAVGTLLTFLGSEAFNGLAYAEGRSAVYERLGQRIVAPSINLSDAPRYAGTLPRAYDAEGVPKAPLPLIQDGVAHRVVHDTASAAIAGGGAVSTGHALAPGGSTFGPVPMNLVLVGGGARDEAELMAPIQRGIYVTRVWYVRTVHERTMQLTGMTRDGTFLIEDGKIVAPLRDVRFTDSIIRILGATQDLTAGQRLVAEAEFYGPRYAWGVVCPALRADGFRVTGSTVA